MSRNISEGRKAVYYIGMILIAIGVLIFISNFFSAPMQVGTMGFGISQGPSISGMAGRGLTGMGFIIVGTILMNIGRSGLAGSGVVLDPKRAREELEPWNRSKGGMINDALDEVDLLKNVANNLGKHDHENAEEVIKVRCQHCRVLNDEDARFCKECGKQL